jgi:hypothetical protein
VEEAGICKNGNESSGVPCNDGKLFNGCTTGGLSSNAQLHRVGY